MPHTYEDIETVAREPMLPKMSVIIDKAHVPFSRLYRKSP